MFYPKTKPSPTTQAGKGIVWFRVGANLRVCPILYQTGQSRRIAPTNFAKNKTLAYHVGRQGQVGLYILK